MATLVGAAERLAGQSSAGPLHAALATLARTFVTELGDLRTRCAALTTSPGTTFDPVACALVDRYALVMAAAACVGVWEGRAGTGSFLADPAWAVLALGRIARRLGAPVPDVPAEAQASVLDEVLDRCRDGRSLDLYGTPVAG
jgi:hypothetical protein